MLFEKLRLKSLLFPICTSHQCSPYSALLTTATVQQNPHTSTEMQLLPEHLRDRRGSPKRTSQWRGDRKTSEGEDLNQMCVSEWCGAPGAIGALRCLGFWESIVWKAHMFLFRPSVRVCMCVCCYVRSLIDMRLLPYILTHFCAMRYKNM